MYWILAKELADEDGDAYLTGDVDFELGGDVSFKRGISLSGLNIPNMTLTLSDDSRSGKMNDNLIITEVYGLVFSARFRELLSRIGVNNIEYYNLNIVNPVTHEEYSDYRIANVVGLVDCVDKEKSDLKYYDNGDIKRIRKLVLDESRIPAELRIFRLSNRKIIAVVHQSIKDAIDDAGITGCVFYRPEEYH